MPEALLRREIGEAAQLAGGLTMVEIPEGAEAEPGHRNQ